LERIKLAINWFLRKLGYEIINEEVLDPSPRLNSYYVDFYHSFKKRHSYSDLAIAQKREALENVLIPYGIDENLSLLTRAGFSVADVFFRWYNWCGFIAAK
jgi:tRNA (cmo5U34)-methyltransferase